MASTQDHKDNSNDDNSNNNDDDDEWDRPPTPYHAHFDCFSGAAGDMMLAACLDAAGADDRSQSNRLLRYIARQIENGLTELQGEFSLTTKQVWRGMGSIAALHVKVQSKYHHEAAPVPTSRGTETKVSDNRLVHDHHHHHLHHNQYHSHSHLENTSSGSDHEHSHEHSQEHSHNTNSSGHGQQYASDSDSKSHLHSHSHSHSHDASAGDAPNHTLSHSHSHHHNHQSSSSTRGPLRNLPQIQKMLQDAPVEFIPIWVKENAIQAFTELAHAEALTHGAASINAVHFHKVGAIDSIVDTVGTLLALHALHVTTVSCSRLPLGEGTVWTDHGLLPVPAPATLRLMVGMPTCPGPRGLITGELVTPTAAALLRVLVLTKSASTTACSSTLQNPAAYDNHHEANNGIATAVPSPTMDGRPPAFTIRRIGIGAGTKDFEKHPNILRLMLGDNILESRPKK